MNMNNMKKHNYLIGIIILSVLAVLSYNYWKVMIKQDYLLTDFVQCDPEIESCFVSNCGEECDGLVPEYFKIIKKRAYDVKGCEKKDHDCLPFTCEKGDHACTVEYCSKKSTLSGYPCDEINQ